MIWNWSLLWFLFWLPLKIFLGGSTEFFIFRYHVVEYSFLLNQLPTRPLFHDLPPLKYYNLVIIQNICDLFSRIDDGRSLQLLSQDRLNNLICYLVQIRSSIVHDYNGSFSQDNSRHRNELSLPITQLYIVIFQRWIDAVFTLCLARNTSSIFVSIFTSLRAYFTSSSWNLSKGSTFFLIDWLKI